MAVKAPQAGVPVPPGLRPSTACSRSATPGCWQLNTRVYFFFRVEQESCRSQSTRFGTFPGGAIRGGRVHQLPEGAKREGTGNLLPGGGGRIRRRSSRIAQSARPVMVYPSVPDVLDLPPSRPAGIQRLGGQLVS